MAIKLYDTLSGKKKTLKPRSANMIEIFVCGPTVYDYSHIGHARTYIAFDAFVKYLRFKGYNVRYVQNITDIDDKIIARAKILKSTPRSVARMFETEYEHDMEALKIDSADRYARATDYIKHIILQIDRLLKKGYVYKTDDGIYYDISKFKHYGKLSNRTVEQAEDAVSRIDDSTQKRNKGDFAIWKFSKKGEPKWSSPWGDGRPGWHIEDTAITETEFGAQYDIHGGARDLIFPHHESEIALMESISDKDPLVNYWMHTGFLTVNGEKMSKSLGNFITIHEFLKKHSRETFRLFVLSSHYRSPIDYTERSVKQAEVNVKRLGDFYQKIQTKAGTALAQKKEPLLISKFRKNFDKNLADDFNTPKALAALFDFIREGNAHFDSEKISVPVAAGIKKFLNDINAIFHIIPAMRPVSIPPKVKALIRQREQLRKNRKWKEADNIRSKIEEMGYSIDDTAAGPDIKQKA